MIYSRVERPGRRDYGFVRLLPPSRKFGFLVPSVVPPFVPFLTLLFSIREFRLIVHILELRELRAYNLTKLDYVRLSS